MREKVTRVFGLRIKCVTCVPVQELRVRQWIVVQTPDSRLWIDQNPDINDQNILVREAIDSTSGSRLRQGYGVTPSDSNFWIKMANDVESAKDPDGECRMWKQMVGLR